MRQTSSLTPLLEILIGNNYRSLMLLKPYNDLQTGVRTPLGSLRHV
ncbi:hypothetical protein GALL_399040 [mine drainage metagenome]|uniref:Uncharacterized protein n=1 Tax=mine drainage metagenome TaxID=410659 RepID=A0A1J5Q4W0_9ZZZZ